MKMLDSTRLRNPQLFDKIVTPEEAAALITDGMNVGVSGFTPSGYPKKTTIALAKAIKEGKRCRINIWSGASVGPEIEEELAAVGAIKGRMPYYAASNKSMKKGINEGKSIDNEVVISCEQVVNNFVHQHLDFTISEEKKAVCTLAEKVESYLYEPGAALLKAGAYRILSERYGVKKLHANSHLYTSDVEVDFPGRCFRVLAVSGFGKKELKSFLQGVEKANLTVRNFPSTVAELRKKLKLKEGGDVYLFATTLANGDKVLIKCEKLNSEKNIS